MWFLDRLKEPSTHAGLSMLFVAAASFFPQYAMVINIIAGVLGFSAVVTPEQRTNP